MTVITKTHHNLPSGHVCSVELLKGLGCGTRNFPRRVSVDSSPRCGVVFLFVPSPITSPSAAEAARGGEQEGRLRLRAQFVTVTLAANMRGGMWTQIVYEGKTDRVRPHGPLFPRQLVTISPTHWITQEVLLDMIDAVDTDMNARAGDAELIPWLLVLDCAPQHVAKEFRSIMRDTRSHIKLCHVQRNFAAHTHSRWSERTCELSRAQSAPR